MKKKHLKAHSSINLFFLHLICFFFLLINVQSLPAFQQDPLQRVISLVVENHPLLESQRSLMEEIEKLPKVRGLDTKLSLKVSAGARQDEDTGEILPASYGGLGLEIPLYSASRGRAKAKETLAIFKDYEKAKQDYIKLKNSIISELLSKVTKLHELSNEKENLGELKTLLSHNVQALEKQVEAGLAGFSDLWDIRERIMKTRTRLQNISMESKALKREIALNFGGERWEDLLEMLEGLE